MNEGMCPICLTQRIAGTRYCRQCGLDLGSYDDAVVAGPARAVSAEGGRSSRWLRILDLDITWKALRGIVTLAIAVPFFLFMAVVGGNLGLSTLIVVESLMVVFIYLAIRDLKEVGAWSTRPLTSEPQLRAGTTRRKLELEASPDRIGIATHEPTTLRLESTSSTGETPTASGDSGRNSPRRRSAK